METTKTSPKVHGGSCHCGAVRYEVEIDATHGSQCNCTVCTKVGGIGAIVKPPAFRVVAGEDQLTTYGRPEAARFFCRTCGVHCFGKGDIPELGGAFVSVRLNTLDDVDPAEIHLGHWDGFHDNWHAGMRETPWPNGRGARPRVAVEA
ncbi:MAG: GFA family protein [Myxococcales bacterium]|nr:GFA family protein [Myxococcales bacterium]